jgi:hypothetical protein
VLVFDSTLAEWGAGESIPAPIQGAAAAGISSGILIAGGRNDAGRSDDVYLYQPDRADSSETAWLMRANIIYRADQLSAAGFGDIVYLFGTSDDAGDPILQEYILSENVWQLIRIPIEGKWSEQAVVQSGNDLFVLGGVTDTGIVDKMMGYQAIFTVLIPFIR